MRARSWLLVVAAVVWAAGCVDADPPALRTLVTVIATQDGQPVEEATERLVQYGRRSLVVVEAALHMANAPGRKRLVRAVRRLGDEDGCALLGHVARYDDDAAVRHEARSTLEQWSTDRTVESRSRAATNSLAAANIATR